MPPATEKPPSNPGLNLALFTIPQYALLQVGTASMLLLVSASKITAEALIAMGQASEEVFRASMLPILEFPLEKGNRGFKS
ncbi:MAG: hypothetical protein KME60_15080 [Cyanomargarita calcarea GSE-NOS-MK-12-04C]|uniref:Uncharacterized protein n=1 Tax=Cyanomargarita calcarea GSE-NOS-MK-12-04C TaxID=2839659 RepID=A0A951QPE7_9CYAN|nr:hypothetical protein [Cyanomargarita calcarea GSE-NOS-MK-12-04C]